MFCLKRTGQKKHQTPEKATRSVVQVQLAGTKGHVLARREEGKKKKRRGKDSHPSGVSETRGARKARRNG